MWLLDTTGSSTWWLCCSQRRDWRLACVTDGEVLTGVAGVGSCKLASNAVQLFGKLGP